ncbi:DNA mismatch repair protein PMS1 [Linum perenne]
MEGGCAAPPAGSSSPATPKAVIKPINKSVVHRICAGQVILDLQSAVKELVENSLDAGATSIEICLKEYGQEWFQVIDNGCGISPDNYKVVALKHHTSKLCDFPDLQSMATFGFRGEAISSLCALGDVTMETRTKNETVGTHLSFDHLGVLIGERRTARQVGTTVTVKKLFSNLPVRSKEFKRNMRKEFGKLISLLNAYALIAKGVRFICSNTTAKNAKSVVLKTQGSDSLKDNIITVLGVNIFSCLQPVSIPISDGCKVDGFLSKPGQGSGRNLGDRQYYFVNGRPVDMPKVNKLVNEAYKGANSKQYPIAILNFTLPTKECDVNVTPDKRKVFLSDESTILLGLKGGLQQIYSPSNASYAVNQLEECANVAESPKLPSSERKSYLLSKQESSADGRGNKEICRDNHEANVSIPFEGVETEPEPEPESCDVSKRLGTGIDEKFAMKGCSIGMHQIKKADSLNKSIKVSSSVDVDMDQNASSTHRVIEKDVNNKDWSIPSSTVQSTLKKFVTVNKRKHEDIGPSLSEIPILRNQIVHSPPEKRTSGERGADKSLFLTYPQSGYSNNRVETEIPKNLGADESRSTLLSEISAHVEEGKEDPAVEGNLLSMEEVARPISEDAVSDVIVDAPMLSTANKISSTLQFSFQDLTAKRKQIRSRSKSHGCATDIIKIKSHPSYAAATMELSQPDDDERKSKALVAATTELDRFFQKEDFGRMKVIGQFNLGFIIGKLDKDLFIVDQVIYFITSVQSFVIPMRLEFTPEEELVAAMNMDIIRKNGFTLEEDENAPPGFRFKLEAVPFSKNITFGVEDVKDLISTLADDSDGTVLSCSYKMDTVDSVCPSRVRAMLANRACRSSVMIGDPLNRNEMQKILEHLSGLKSPWNCPHGRPTMRHLVDLTSIYRKSQLSLTYKGAFS